MKLQEGDIVSVTGASGFVASEIVANLLQRGIRVQGTVRSLSDPSRTVHLRALPGADKLLTLFEADLNGPTSAFAVAFEGAKIVFHTACPFVVTKKAEPLGEE